jgi:hypothetical protein
MQKTLIVVFLALRAVFSAHAQTGDEIETLLAEQRLSYGQAARFVLEAADLVSLPDAEAAFNYAADRNWLPKNASARGIARLDGISLLLMRAFELKGGFFYTHIRTAHYAYRDMVSKKVIQDRADPAMPVSGSFLIFLTGRVMSIKENIAITALEG